MPALPRSDRWAALGAIVSATVVAVDLAGGTAVQIPVAVAIGPFVAAIGARVAAVVALGLATVAATTVLVLVDDPPADSAALRIAATAIGAFVAVMAAVGGRRRDAELARARPDASLTELSRRLVHVVTMDDIVAVVDEWARRLGASWVVVETTDPAAIEEPLRDSPVSRRSARRTPIERRIDLGDRLISVGFDARTSPDALEVVDRAAGLLAVAADRARSAARLGRATRRLAALQRATAALAAAPRCDDVAQATVRAARGLSAADRATLYHQASDGTAEVVAGDPVGLVPPEVMATLRDGRPTVAEGPPEVAATRPSTSSGHRDAAYLAVPVSLAGLGVDAVLHLGFDRSRRFSGDDLATLDALVTMTGSAWRRALALEQQERARDTAIRRARHAEELDRLTAALGVADDRRHVADAFLGNGFDAVGASFGAVLLLDTTARTLRPFAVRASRRGRIPDVIPLEHPTPITDAVRDDRPVFLGDRAAITAAYPDAEVTDPETGPDGEVAWSVLPLRAATGCVGALALSWSRRRRFADDEREFLRLVADRLSTALERAEAREARQRDEQRWEHVALAASVLAEAAGPDDTLRRFSRWAVPTIADVCTVHLGESSRAPAHVFHWPADPDAGATATRIDRPTAGCEDTLIGEAFRSGRPALAASGDRVAVPLVRRDRVIGVLAVEMGRSGRRYDERDVGFISDLADRVAGAYERAQLLEVERRAVVELQRSLLPLALPDVEGWELAAAYRAAGAHAGGDWYDVDPDGGHLRVTVGDVAGHGLEAAADMARFHNAMRALAVDGAPPAAVLDRLTRFVHADARATIGSVVSADIDRATGATVYTSAGHLPPLLRAADGPITVLDAPHGPPIGVADHAPYRSSTLELRPGDSLVLYSDGLVERRDEPITAGIDRLAATWRRIGPGSAERTCAELVEALVPAQPRDDVALVVVRRS